MMKRIIFLLAVASATSIKKPYRLELLELLPITGQEPATGKSCRSASETLVKYFNQQTKFLPDYELVLDIKDEGTASLQATRRTLEFVQRFQKNDFVFPSPVVVGPSMSNNCKALAPALHHINMAAVSIACAAPFLTDRFLYPNLYLMRSTGRYLTFPQIRFIKDVGKWNRIGIITNANAIFDYDSASYLERLANEQGVEVGYYDSLIDFDDDAMRIIKGRDIRVMVVFTSSFRLAYKFLCLAKKYGMSGPRYAFLLLGIAYTDPMNIPSEFLPGCTRSTIIEQMQTTFFVAPLMFPNDPTVTSTIGYNTLEFEKMYDEYTNSSREIDYDRRILCHDTLLQGLLVLDDADRRLKKLNMSLRSFYDHPQLVMETVNRSAAEIDYIGLRMGRMRYNRRGEVDADVQMIGSWNPGDTVLQYNFLVRQYLDTQPFNYSSYWIERVKDVKWTTLDGKPPRDRRLEVTIQVEVDPNIHISIITIAALLSIVQALLFGLTSFRKPRSMIRVISFMGCIGLDLVAVLFVLSNSQASLLVWEARFVLLLVSGAVISSSFFGESAIYWHRVKDENTKFRTRTRTRTRTANMQMFPHHRKIAHTQSNVSAVTQMSQKFEPSMTLSNIQPSVIALMNRRIHIFVALSIAIVALYLSFCLTLSAPLKCKQVKLMKEPVYDRYQDTMTEYQTTICGSDRLKVWQYLAAVIIVVMLIAATYFSRKLANVLGQDGDFDLKSVATLNMLTSVVGAWLILVLLGDSPISQQVAVSTAALLISASNFSILQSRAILQLFQR